MNWTGNNLFIGVVDIFKTAGDVTIKNLVVMVIHATHAAVVSKL